MKRKWIAALGMGMALLAGTARANDNHNNNDNPQHQCIAGARSDRQACNQVCRDDFLSAIDTCRGLNHDCAQQARDARDACVSDILTALRQCVQDTCGDFQTVIDQCRKNFPAGSPERDSCIDGQQVLRFQCRDACRESVQLFAGLKACRDEFKADIKACPAPTPTPTPMGP
jgi:hypothetical protein